MNKADFVKRIKNIPDDAEIEIHERGACHDWTPTNVFHNPQTNRLVVRNYTAKQVKKQRWPA